MSILPSTKRVNRSTSSAMKIMLYAPPGFGKSYWADKFPDPLFLNTDGNLQYLSAPGIVIKYWYSPPKTSAPEVVASSFVNVVEELIVTNGGGFKTVVVDLVEGIYALCRQAKLKELGVADESDIPFGKAYKLIREEVIAQIDRLRALPINVILLSHEKETIIKDRIGREYTFYSPALDDKFLKPISGTGFTLRGYWKDIFDEQTGESRAVRMLSLSPKSEEFSVKRFVNAAGNPVLLEDIELTYENVDKLFEEMTDPDNSDNYQIAGSDALVSVTAKERAAALQKPKPKSEPIIEKPEPVKVQKPEPVKVQKPEPKSAPVEPKPEIIKVQKEQPAVSGQPITESQQEKIARIQREVAEAIARSKGKK